MITDQLKSAFRYHMRNGAKQPFRAQGYVAPMYRGESYAGPNDGIGHAVHALNLARDDVATGKKRYPHPLRGGNNGKPNSKGYLWIENPADMGLRFAGYADELTRLDHHGWYTDPDGFETMRGTVYQLPGRNGKGRYVAAHDNSCNGDADSNGPAYVDFSDIYESDFEWEMRSALATIGKQYRSAEMLRPGYWAESAHETARKEAARAADEFTRVQAEQEREYQTAWQAGNRFADVKEELENSRESLRELLADRRKARAKGKEYPAICDAIRATVASLLRDIRALRAERDKLPIGERESLYFYPDKRLQEAFNDGAGESVFA